MFVGPGTGKIPPRAPSGSPGGARPTFPPGEEEARMRLAGLSAAVLAAGCAWTGTTQTPMSVWVRSHNQSPVDVYLLCGERDARWLGAVDQKSSDAFEVPAGQPLCALGYNFFVVVQKSNRGYWVGPVRTAGLADLQLVVEKYAGLSQAYARRRDW
jgi:hypothetical protein